MIIPGTDGKKMSKSYDNCINILGPEKILKKQIMNIVTDSRSLDEPKDPTMCNVFQIYKLIASESDVTKLEHRYKNGGLGYGHAKKELFELILEIFKEPRKKFKLLIENPDEIEHELFEGAKKASKVADSVMGKVKAKLGLN